MFKPLWSKDIGMFAINRPIEKSCHHKTKFCESTCYNNKLYAAFGHAMNPKDILDENAWQENNSSELARTLSRKRNQTKRVRLMSRGEAFADLNDIDRVENILKDNPDSIFWIPTRSWRNSILWSQVDRLRDYDNVRILASMDPSNTAEDWQQISDLKLSTMFYGDDNLKTTPIGEKFFKCPKTWKHLTGHCGICKAGCFKSNKPVNVYLKQH